jgi:hypothetical protein
MTDWDATIQHLRSTPGEELMVASGVGTSRCRPLLGKGLTLRTVRTSARGEKPVAFDIYAMHEAPADAAPYRIMSLVETCTMSHHDDTKDNEAVKRGSAWMEANPGRWFIVGEIDAERGSRHDVEIGMSLGTARRNGFEAVRLNSKVYARLPHPSGLPLSDFVTRHYERQFDPLPKLERDKFDWSFSELLTAAETARDWLFVRELHAAA